MRIALAAVISLLTCSVAHSQLKDPYLDKSAPSDKVVSFSQEPVVDKDLKLAMEQARSTYPDARRRYLAGLPPKYSFFVTVDLRDDQGLRERVFLAVDEISDGKVHGRIWNEITLVKGYTYKQSLVVPEDAVLDWLISHPDGTEEGNLIGKYLEAKEGTQSQ
jgi:Uncharacterized protein conserved in bacteria (DUF2314)